MSTGTILFAGIGVFSLMVIGIVLTGLEFRKMDRQSTRKSSRVGRDN